MSNNGTGFWMIVALMLIFSIVALIEAAIRFVSARIQRSPIKSERRRWQLASLQR